MHKRNVLNSPRLLELKKKRRKILIRKILILSIGLVVLFGGLSYVSKISALNIAQAEVVGNKVIDSEAIIGLVEEELAGKYLWLFPKKNIFLYPKSTIKENLGGKYKRLTNINISLEKDKKLLVSVDERTPEYMWCGDMPRGGEVQETCYFMDKEGFVFDDAPYFSGEVYFKFYGEIKKGENASGKYIAEGYFSKLIALKDALVGLELVPVIIYIKEGEDLEILLSKKTSDSNPKIIFKKNSDFEKISENLKAVLTTEPLLSRVRDEYSKLEYIDLRFGNKVYHKFR